MADTFDIFKVDSLSLIRNTYERFFDKPAIRYRNNRFKFIMIKVLEAETRKIVANQLSRLINASRRNPKKEAEDMKRNEERKQRREELIKRQENQVGDWGIISVPVDGGSHLVRSNDMYGRHVGESLIIYYDDPEDSLTFTDFTNEGMHSVESSATTTEYTTKRWFHIDLAPEISAQSQKNVVLTQVQGRDYTRKELVSGGDLSFSVNGNIVSNTEGIYPEAAVRRFLKIMQHNGILSVKSFQFNQLNVTNIIIKDFSLGQPTYKNIQPYSFSCVAVEPDEDITTVIDTIAEVNRSLSESTRTEPVNVDKILVDRLKQFGKDLLIDAAVFSVDMALNNEAFRKNTSNIDDIFKGI